MTIIDNRVLISNADALDPADGVWESDGGVAMDVDLSSTTVEVIKEGTDAVATRVSNNDNGILFNTESAQNWSNNFFYLWINMLQSNILDLEVNGGMTIRFTGPTVTDWFEVNVGGVDTYGGGWVVFVIDIEAASATPDLTNGTPPATNAIQRVGAHFRAIGAAPGNALNCIVDAIWRLPTGVPGIVIRGRKQGVTPYTIQDVLDAADNSDTTKAWGVIERLRNGTISLNTPIQIGAFAGPGSPNAGIGSPILTDFTDTNEVVGWELQRVPDEFYGITVAAGSPITTNFTLGIKTGTGDDATGAQGFVITTAERSIVGSPQSPNENIDLGGTLIRWSMDLSDRNIDAANLYGCSLIGSGTLQLDNSIVESISTLYIEGAQAFVADSTQLRNQIINATPRFQLPGSPVINIGSPVGGSPRADLSYMVTNDIGDIKFCTFGFSEKHALEFTAIDGSPLGSPAVPREQNSVGNRFIGYGADNTLDAAIHNNAGFDLTLNLTEGASIGEHTQHNVGSPVFITLVASVTVTVTVLDTAGDPIENAQTAIFRVSDDFQIMNEDTNGSGVATTGFGGSTPTDVSVRIRKNSPGDTRYFPVNAPATITGDGLNVTITLIQDEIAT